MYFFYSDAKPTLKLIIGKERIEKIENREKREYLLVSDRRAKILKFLISYKKT